MKSLLLHFFALILVAGSAPGQVEPLPPAGEHPLHTNARGFAKRAAGEAATALAKGDRKAALEAYKKAVAQIPEAEALKMEFYLYRARFTALALQLSADALEADDEGSARAYLSQILAADMDPDNPIAKNLLQSIDPKPVAGVGETAPKPPVDLPSPPVTPPATGETTWTYKLGDSVPTINREWGFLLLNNIDRGILVNGDIVELVREDTVLALFKVTLPEDSKDSLVLGVKGVSPIPESIRKGDLFRLKTE